LPIIGKLLGHRNLETTSRYAHLDHDPLKVATNRIGARLTSALGEAPPRLTADELGLIRESRA